jgi:hypothetical protein
VFVVVGAAVDAAFAALGEDFEQPARGFGVVGLHEPEARGVPVGGHRLTGDHLEPPVIVR